MRGRWMVVVVGVAACLVLSGCGMPTTIVKSELKMSPASKFTLSSVVIEHAAYRGTSESAVNKLRQDENALTQHAFAAFSEELKEQGIAGPGEQVRMTVTEIDPGSRALRLWVGFGSGYGHVRAVVNAGACGTFTIDGSLRGGWYGGHMRSMMKKLGKAAALHMAEEAKKVAGS